MSSGAAAAGAAARRAERRLVTHLRDVGAFTSDSASSIANQRWMGKRVLSRLIRVGAIHEVKTGYYLDDVVYSAYRSRRKRNTILAVSTAAVIAAFVIWWASQQV